MLFVNQNEKNVVFETKDVRYYDENVNMLNLFL
jgi:hypothetical protein